MTERWRRTLLRLYPRRMRDRYGAELTDLQDELRARGELTRVGVVRDTVIGALRSRSVGQRAGFVAALAAAALLTTVALTGARHAATRRPPVARLLARVAGRLPRGAPQPCFITDGGPCSITAACSEFVAEPVSGARPPRLVRPRHPVATCIDDPREVQPRPQFVSSALPAARSVTGRRARAGRPRG